MTYLIDAWLDRPHPYLRILHRETGEVCAVLEEEALDELRNQGDLDVNELSSSEPIVLKELVREDRAAITTITAVRTAVFDEFFATEAHATVAAVTGLYSNGYFIYKFHNARLPPQGRAEQHKYIRLLQK